MSLEVFILSQANVKRYGLIVCRSAVPWLEVLRNDGGDNGNIGG